MQTECLTQLLRCPLQGVPAAAQPPPLAHLMPPLSAGPPANTGAHAGAHAGVQRQQAPAKTGAPQAAACPGEQDGEEAPASVPPVLAAIWDQSPGYAGEVQALREIEELKQAARKLALATAQQQHHELSASC